MYDIDNKYHPSFVSLIPKINERGYRSPYAYVSFETEEGHIHHMPIGNGTDNLIVMGDSIEDIANEFIKVLAACNPSKHKGKGRQHNPSQYKDAYHAVITQLMNTDFDTEHAHQVWLEKMYKKWGGHIPAAVLMPVEEQWQMVVPDFKGDPEFYKIKEGALDNLPMPVKEKRNG
tara:strand:- start:584 stop:1105 length:522 start_codon:yes stop_codon:yes gene_type:complete